MKVTEYLRPLLLHRHFPMSTKKYTPFNIDNVIILGASIMSYTMIESEVNSLTLKEYGKVVNVKNRAVAGQTVAQLATNAATQLSEFSYTNAIVFVHIGGNEVTSNRPYDEAEKAGMLANLTTIKNAILARGWVPVFSDISFRDYDAGACWYNEGTGSKPYNDNIYHQFCLDTCPAWAWSDGVSMMDFYNFSYNNPWFLLQTDYIHPDVNSYYAYQRQFVKTIMHRNYVGAPQRSMKRTGNKLADYSDNYMYCSFGSAAYRVSSDGVPINFGSTQGMLLNRGFNSNPITITTSGFTGVADTGGTTGNNSGFLKDAQFTGFLYATSTDGTAKVTISGLRADRTYTLRVSGSRITTEVRTTGITIGGVKKTYNASTAAGANTMDGVTFTGIVPVNGQIIMAVTKEAGTYSHIGGFDLIEEH